MVTATYTDEQLAYSAGARCSACSAGLAHPLDHADALRMSAWCCSAVLKGDADTTLKHDRLPFAFYEVKSEFQPSAHGATTRPAGTEPRLAPECTCGKCGHQWRLEPYRPNSGLVAAGVCPGCGNTNGADGSARFGGDAPPAITVRYLSAVVTATP